MLWQQSAAVKNQRLERGINLFSLSLATNTTESLLRIYILHIFNEGVTEIVEQTPLQCRVNTVKHRDLQYRVYGHHKFSVRIDLIV